MANDGISSFNVKGLDQLLKALKAKPPKARVGILGDTSRERKKGDKSAPTNAEIGAAHEFGSIKRNLPQRSFLRMPIADNLQNELDNAGLLGPDQFAQVIRDGSVIPWLNKVAIAAEACVADAFETSGGGKWPAWKSASYSNNTGQLLVDTQQLRNSITSEVK